MTRTFSCPSCGASLDYGDSDDPVVRCPYCDSMVIVPEDLRPQSPGQQPSMWAAAPTTGAPLTIDLRGLTGKISKLRAIKQLVRDGQVPEAAKVYQQAFGVNAAEAQGVVDNLASGQSVVISGATFSSSIPTGSGSQGQAISGDQVAQIIANQLDVSQQWQHKITKFVGCIIILFLLSFVACAALSIAGGSLLEQLF